MAPLAPKGLDTPPPPKGLENGLYSDSRQDVDCVCDESAAAWNEKAVALLGELLLPGGVCNAAARRADWRDGEGGAEGRSRAPLPQGLERPCTHTAL